MLMSLEWSREAIGRRLGYVRRAMGLTQAQMCRKLGIGTGKWANWETGNRLISVNEALMFSKATGVPVGYIYQGFHLGLPAHLADTIARIEREDGDNKAV